MNPQHAEARRQALEEAAQLVEKFYTNGDNTQGWQDIFAAKIRALAAPHAGAAPERPLVITSAPERIWLDLGGVRHLIDPDTRFSELADVTWSEDNATGHGIEYVRADVAQSDPAVAAESAEQRAVPAGWTDDQMIRFGWLCVSGLSVKDMSLAERLEVFRQHEALRGVAAPAPCAMVGLTDAEVDAVEFDNSGDMRVALQVFADAITRAFCQKNKLPAPEALEVK